ncbi:hypothetical protein JCM6882_008678 [Rhodosporidiobolus microsporus]
MDDPAPATSFARVDDFVAGAQNLTQLDFHAEPTQEDERRELAVLQDLCGMLDGYQEQPHLLDASLEQLVSPLLAVLREQVRRQNPPLEGKRLNRLARLVYFVTKVRGSKVIVGFFPHETSDLSLLIPLLSDCFSPSPSSSASPLANASWELRYILLLWLSVAIRIPFDLKRLDERAPEKVQELGFEALKRASKEGDGAMEVLARFYCRQDAPLQNLFTACEQCFSQSDKPTLITAHLSLLSSVLRNALPAVLLQHWSSLYQLLAFLPPSITTGKSGALMAKMRCKVAGRLALLRLTGGQGGEQRREQEEEEVPEEVEVIVGELIEGLGHPDTLPRYSSAKYLSRLCSALPSSFSSQIVDAVLSTLEEALSEANDQGLADQAEGKVQGACLACGEMARRGLLGIGAEGEAQIGRVVEGVLQALAFDHLHLSRSLGTSARDSAAYVLWSLSRTLSSTAAAPHGQNIAERLVCTALFDREVQVRRAASAAFQEGVGRWSIFPHGIDVLRKVDFFTVSVRHRAYLQAAPFVAEHVEYRSPVLSHLLETGISHYDADLRTLSAKALGAVVAQDAQTLAPSLVASQLEKLRKTKDSAKLHGLLLSLAALAEAASSLPTEPREELHGQIFTSTTALLVPCARQLKSSPLVLSAALSSLAASAPSSSPSPPSLPSDWFELVLKACEHADEDVHVRAGEAMGAVSAAVNCEKELDHRSGTRQQAAVLMLGKVVLPTSAAPSDGSLLVKVFERLIQLLQREGPKKAATIEARRNGVEAFAALVCEHNLTPAIAPLRPAIFTALLLGFSDYTTDQRGDVGSWVRIATLNSWSCLLPALFVSSSPASGDVAPPSPPSEELADKVVACMAKQAVERLDNVREVAGKALMRVWGGPGEKVLRKGEVWEAIASEERPLWRELSWASERILPLLEVEEYRAEVLEGAVLATSQFSSSTPFLDFALSLPPLPTSPDDPTFTLSALLTSLHALAKSSFSSNRLFVPFLHLVTALAEAGCLDEVVLDEAGEGGKVVERLLAVSTNAVGKMKTPQRVGAAGKVVTAFLALPHVAPSAAEKVLLFLSHPLGWLRQQVAEDLFGQLGALGLDEEEELEALLTETTWNSPGHEEAAKKVGELLQAALDARERWY